MMKNTILTFLLVLLFVGCKMQNGGPLEISGLTVEMQKNPEGVSTLHPRFSWLLASDKQDVMQTAYQIEVATSEKDLKDSTNLVWNTGHVVSDQSSMVEYAGAPLESNKKYYWRVTVWSNTGNKAESCIQSW